MPGSPATIVQGGAVTFPANMNDFVGLARVDSYVEVKSTTGLGILVVSAADAAALIAAGGWA